MNRFHGIELRDHDGSGGNPPLTKGPDEGHKPRGQGPGVEGSGRLPGLPILAPQHDAVRPDFEGKFQEALCGRHAELKAPRRVACVSYVALANRPQILAHAKTDRVRSRQLAERQSRVEFPTGQARRLAQQAEEIQSQGEFAHGFYWDPPSPRRRQSARCWANPLTRLSSSPSTMTRTLGSVPLYRMSTRPAPASSASTLRTASSISGMLSRGRFSATRTLTSTCGKRIKPETSSESIRPLRFMIASAWSAVIRPSPVVLWSRKTMWPDCSPPRL